MKDTLKLYRCSDMMLSLSWIRKLTIDKSWRRFVKYNLMKMQAQQEELFCVLATQQVGVDSTRVRDKVVPP